MVLATGAFTVVAIPDVASLAASKLSSRLIRRSLCRQVWEGGRGLAGRRHRPGGVAAASAAASRQTHSKLCMAAAASSSSSSTSQPPPQPVTRKTAAALIIGDEILTGKTLDTNSNFLAKFLEQKFGRGVTLNRIEVIPDDVDNIGESVRRLSQQVDYVFTSGGIGPTHDDMTYEVRISRKKNDSVVISAVETEKAEDRILPLSQLEIRTGIHLAIARAYGVGLYLDQDVVAKMREVSPDKELNPATLRMATIPEGSEKVYTTGLWVPLVVVNDNVYILPGVPRIFERMIEGAKERFGEIGTARARRLVYTKMHEGQLAESLGSIASRYPHIAIGSYPKTTRSDVFNVKVSVEGDTTEEVDIVTEQIMEAVNGSENENLA